MEDLIYWLCCCCLLCPENSPLGATSRLYVSTRRQRSLRAVDTIEPAVVATHVNPLHAHTAIAAKPPIVAVTEAEELPTPPVATAGMAAGTAGTEALSLSPVATAGMTAGTAGTEALSRLPTAPVAAATSLPKTATIDWRTQTRVPSRRNRNDTGAADDYTLLTCVTDCCRMACGE